MDKLISIRDSTPRNVKTTASTRKKVYSGHCTHSDRRLRGLLASIIICQPVKAGVQRSSLMFERNGFRLFFFRHIPVIFPVMYCGSLLAHVNIEAGETSNPDHEVTCFRFLHATIIALVVWCMLLNLLSCFKIIWE